MQPQSVLETETDNNTFDIPSKYNEMELVALLRDGRGIAYIYLFDNYSGALFSAILAIIPDQNMAADILQEVFINIHRKINTYDNSKSRLYTWMLNIARKESNDIIKNNI